MTQSDTEENVLVPRDNLILLAGAYMGALLGMDASAKDRALLLTIDLLKMEQYTVYTDYQQAFNEVVKNAHERLELDRLRNP